MSRWRSAEPTRFQNTAPINAIGVGADERLVPVNSASLWLQNGRSGRDPSRSGKST